MEKANIVCADNSEQATVDCGGLVYTIQEFDEHIEGNGTKICPSIGFIAPPGCNRHGVDFYQYYKQIATRYGEKIAEKQAIRRG